VKRLKGTHPELIRLADVPTAVTLDTCAKCGFLVVRAHPPVPGVGRYLTARHDRCYGRKGRGR
jgi:hypothetical protein